MPSIVNRVAIVLAAIGLSASAVAAQDFSYGEELFKSNCSACHGLSAAGDGPVGVLFNTDLIDLRLLAEYNDGHFPFSEVYQAINGTREVQAHGLEMPVWGSAFTNEVLHDVSAAVGRELVQGRILALTYYIQSIQK